MIKIIHIIGYIGTVIISIITFIAIVSSITKLNNSYVIERCDKLNSVLINNTVISCNVEKEIK